MPMASHHTASCCCCAAGMSAGLPKFVTVNLSDLEKSFEAGATVDLAAVQDKKLLNISGRDSNLGLKVRLGVWIMQPNDVFRVT